MISRTMVMRRLAFAAAVAAATAVVVVAARHVVSVTGRVHVGAVRTLVAADFEHDLEAAAASPKILRSPGVGFARGWTQAGRWGLWALAEGAELRLLLEDVRDRRLTFECRAYPHLPEGVQQVVTITLGGVEVGRFEPSRRWHLLEVPLPASAQRTGVNTLLMEFTAGVVPADIGRGVEGRAHAFGVRSVTLEAGDGSGRGGVASVPAVEYFGSDRAGAGVPVTVDGTATLVTPLELDGRERRLEVKVSWRDARGTRPAVISPRAITGDGRELRPDPLVLGPDMRSTRRSYPLEGIGRGTVVAAFEVDAGSPVDVTFEMRLRSSQPPSPPTAPAGGGAPDIVVLILDAARPDRFGCYGHERDTTPVIDHLADRSLVFRNVFALAPYTLCSVPTMLTGTSFASHGVVEPEDRLSEGAVTLAEVLRDAGYHTAAFTASPNNGRGKGYDQGFEDFWESWQAVKRGRQSRDPFRLSREVVGWLEARTDPRPLFLVLHYIPPHEPYDPEPRFDRWSDPSYDGPVDGWYPTLKAFDQGRMVPTAADLRQVADLYDGNLRRADAAVGAVLRQLRSRPRWSDTVVLVTSDHGEALFEHGRATHNSTVYDEMLAVPFILRLPDSGRPEAVALDRLATLADMAPTLSALAGVPMATAADGVDLLAPAGDAIPNRFFVARTSNRLPQYGVRTLAYKAVVSPFGTGELYDLRQDPGETVDLMLERFPVYSALEMLATRTLNAPRTASVPDTVDDVGEDELELLRELGYVE